MILTMKENHLMVDQQPSVTRSTTVSEAVAALEISLNWLETHMDGVSYGPDQSSAAEEHTAEGNSASPSTRQS